MRTEQICCKVLLLLCPDHRMLLLYPTSWLRVGLHCSAVGPVRLGVCLKEFALALFFFPSSLQTFLLQIWLLQLCWWHESKLGVFCIHLLFGTLPVFFSGIQAVEAKAEWNFMKLSRLIKLCAFNPSLIAVKGHFSSLWAFSLLNCKELLYWWQKNFIQWL